eukprot:SAG31_NODE_3586_length_4094_cov_15.710388_2_plen_91_part_00
MSYSFQYFGYLGRTSSSEPTWERCQSPVVVKAKDHPWTNRRAIGWHLMFSSAVATDSAALRGEDLLALKTLDKEYPVDGQLRVHLFQRRG